MPVLAGSITFPYITNAYVIGDNVSKIAGREVSLRESGGEGQGEGAQYPVVVAVMLQQSDSGQTTTIQLSDRRAEPQRA